MFGPCKVCQEKDKRIADLKAMLAIQVEQLKKATDKPDPFYSSAVNGEMNRIMDGGGPQLSIDLEKQKEISAVEREAIALLTGTY